MRKHNFFPVVFLIFGIFLIGTVSTVSIKSYIKNNKNLQGINESNNDKSNASQTGAADKNSTQIFFDKPQKISDKTSIKVYKKKKVLELYADGKLIGRFNIGLGMSIEGKKEMEGDNKIPEGSYYVCYKTSRTKHAYFIGISYPNIDDAKKGLEQGTIDQKNFDRIKKAIGGKRQPPWNTPLGGDVGIHGGDIKNSLTYGCIILSNDDINILKKYVPMNTPVYIYE